MLEIIFIQIIVLPRLSTAQVNIQRSLLDFPKQCQLGNPRICNNCPINSYDIQTGLDMIYILNIQQTRCRKTWNNETPLSIKIVHLIYLWKHNAPVYDILVW